MLLVTLSLDSTLEYDGASYEKKPRYVIKLIGTCPLGDRYDAEIGYKFGILTIPACKGRKSLRDKKSRVLVL